MIDCCKGTPERAFNGGVPPISSFGIMLGNVSDICYVKQNSKQLLITVDPITSNRQSVHAYNTETGILEWQLYGMFGKMKKRMCPKSVCADKKGTLYVLDENNKCVVLLSATGRYVNSILSKNEAISTAQCVRCSKTENVLVVCHQTKGNNSISVFQLQY